MSVRSLLRAVRGMIQRATLTSVDDSKNLQEVQVQPLADDPIDSIEHWQPFGFRARPSQTLGNWTAEALVAHLNGSHDHPVVICIIDRGKGGPTLADGDVSIFDGRGQYVHLVSGKTIVEGAVIHIGGTALAVTRGVVHGEGIDPFTGATYSALGNTTTKVRAG